MYNYYEAVKNDVIEALEDYDLTEYADKDELREALNDELWTNDSVTGNGSGSYTFCCDTAREYVLANTDLMHEAADELGNADQFKDWLWDGEYESIDVSIRCYLLAATIDEVLDDIDMDKGD